MRHFIFIIMSLIIALFAVEVSAATLTLQWNAVDWTVGGKVVPDPAKSGYNLYISDVDSTVKTRVNSTAIASTVTTFNHTVTLPVNKAYYATAFNQFGESGYSIPAYAITPPEPSGLKAFLQQLISWLQSYVATLG